MSVFLSYSREDNLSAVALEAELEAAGLNLFRDPPLLAGDPSGANGSPRNLQQAMQ
jgi:hypothetical protein